MLSSEVEKIVAAAVEKVAPAAGIPVKVGAPAKPEHGDFSYAAMPLARPLKKKPLEIAEAIAAEIRSAPASKDFVAKVDVAPPGYVNMTMTDGFWTARLREILADRKNFGRSDAGHGTKALLEYVSANPTGPLHVGHARNAAVADTVANLMEAAGYSVSREFYVNDVGVQMRNLGRSVWYRYAESFGKLEYPAAAPDEDKLGHKFSPEEKRRYERFGGLYFGDYVRDVAAAFKKREGEAWLAGTSTEEGILEPSTAAVEAARDFAHPILMEEQKKTLERYGVRFEQWFSEKTLHDGKLVDEALDDLRKRGDLYDSWKEEGADEKRPGAALEDPSKVATWFRAKKYADERDRVLVKWDGSKTYLTADIAYHRAKLRRGFAILINAWGADHHGQIPSMRAALTALGFDPKAFHVILIQMVRLLKDGQEVKMSKRSGSYVTLGELIDEVGADAARYLMLMRSPESQLDFDLDLAKKQTNDNPVFYVQYGHARVCSVFAKARAEAPGVDPSKADLSVLTSPMEREMIKRLARFPDEVAEAAMRREPHRVTTYLQDLVRAFHGYYSAKDATGGPAHRIVSDDASLTAARLALADAVRVVLANGLAMCGVSAPEKMEAPEEARA